MIMQDPAYEILAPAGNVDALLSAINNGANAVYFGLNEFNARMKAENFSVDNLANWVDYCHFFGVKTYVTLNTSIKQNEFAKAVSMLYAIYNANSDGVILTDLALLEYAAKTFCGKFDIVASTQLNVHDEYGARFLKNLGATTVVLARETTYENIRKIHKAIDIKLEGFIHGALCVCQSGQCLFSSMVGANSGNRGLCAQPCRQYYDCYLGKNKINEGYLLSPKDLCGLGFAKKLAGSGMSVFKIEGRNRRAQYAGETSHIYSKVFENDFKYESKDILDLQSIYNRGNFVADNFQRGENDGIIYKYSQGHIGRYVGKVKNGNRLSSNCMIEKGDCFKIFNEQHIEVGSAVANESGNNISLSISGRVKPDNLAFITTDSSQIRKVEARRRLLSVDMTLVCIPNNRAKLTVSSNGVSATVESSIDLPIAKNAVSDDEIVRQLSKTSHLHFTISNIVINNNGCFAPKSAINDMRRRALIKLSGAVIQNYNDGLKRRYSNMPYACADNEVDVHGDNTFGIMSVCRNEQQFVSAISSSDVVILDLDVLNADLIERYMRLANGRRWYLDLPPFADLDLIGTMLIDRQIGVVANNIGALQFALQNNLRHIVGHGLNLYNSNIVDTLCKRADAFLYSNELTVEECRKIARPNGYRFVDGKLKLMHIVTCPYKLNCSTKCSECTADDSVLTYTDKMGHSFYFRRRKFGVCSFELINGVKLSAGNKLLPPFNYCIDYDDVIFNRYKSICNGDVITDKQDGDYTKGRLFVKVK
ncbi:MAG: U32 family peptidase [Corallococcus sp.]|nr:U32 family peptidase [Corallococcus sp.]